jgi:hypothetical protein
MSLLLVAVYRMAATSPLYARPEIVRGQQCTDRFERVPTPFNTMLNDQGALEARWHELAPPRRCWS